MQVSEEQPVATGTVQYNRNKWYNNHKFSLVPNLNFQKADTWNTARISGDWLFFKFWTLDSFDFEISFVIDSHWGVGFIGILPYCRWALTIPIPDKVGDWVSKYLWRRPEGHYQDSF